jgi:hypothetical protein
MVKPTTKPLAKTLTNCMLLPKGRGVNDPHLADLSALTQDNYGDRLGQDFGVKQE